MTSRRNSLSKIAKKCLRSSSNTPSESESKFMCLMNRQLNVVLNSNLQHKSTPTSEANALFVKDTFFIVENQWNHFWRRWLIPLITVQHTFFDHFIIDLHRKIPCITFLYEFYVWIRKLSKNLVNFINYRTFLALSDQNFLH